ncbi:hypothetical protein [Pseudomonas sp. Au-Pse12]|uniref:hypothetical protein n=1 Tax=Pseudomonas sp. Au-Pse12 TaxID=2906459 RepID=UPI001E49E014|nr:hypothetical protein [Pseudomonas sp. Au-Pse12]MCE4058395.1 hypothetical protein [Pseudomonas sp. Au-Pse12]
MSGAGAHKRGQQLTIRCAKLRREGPSLSESPQRSWMRWTSSQGTLWPAPEPNIPGGRSPQKKENRRMIAGFHAWPSSHAEA